MRKSCVVDGVGFEAKRPSALYCSERCKKQAQRRPKTGPVGVADMAEKRARADGGLAAVTRSELVAAGRLDTSLGQAVLFIATRIDAVGLVDTGAGVAALVREHRVALAEALRGVADDGDALDDIRGSAALKLLRGAS